MCQGVQSLTVWRGWQSRGAHITVTKRTREKDRQRARNNLKEKMLAMTYSLRWTTSPRVSTTSKNSAAG